MFEDMATKNHFGTEAQKCMAHGKKWKRYLDLQHTYIVGPESKNENFIDILELWVNFDPK